MIVVDREVDLQTDQRMEETGLPQTEIDKTRTKTKDLDPDQPTVRKRYPSRLVKWSTQIK